MKKYGTPEPVEPVLFEDTTADPQGIDLTAIKADGAPAATEIIFEEPADVRPEQG